eukprot:m.67759 g.67759  ORF g.67759 m.67759 type:complete len:590 (+) comp23866_c0_seq1:209-1978(+)
MADYRPRSTSQTSNSSRTSLLPQPVDINNADIRFGTSHSSSARASPHRLCMKCGQDAHSNAKHDVDRHEISLGKVVPPSKKKERLVSLDAVRGLTVCFMILVDNLGSWHPRINHSPWDQVTLADFVMPFFLFMVGCSMSLSFKKYNKHLWKKILTRTAKLFVLGLLTQGGSFPELNNTGYDLDTIRIPGILQRIAFAYGIVGLIAYFIPKLSVAPEGRDPGYFRVFRALGLQWAAALFFFVLYLILMFGITVPSYNYNLSFTELGKDYTQEMTVECGVRGDLTPMCSTTRYIDTMLLTPKHAYRNGAFRRVAACSSCSPAACPKPFACPVGVTHCPSPLFANRTFCVNNPDACAANWCGSQLDPEGTLATLNTVTTTFIGMHFGTVIHLFPKHIDRLKQWIPMSLTMLTVGLIIHTQWPANKQLWTPAYVFIMGGGNGILLAIFYVLLDYKVWQPKAVKVATQSLRPFVWVGMNTIFIYLFSPSGDLWERLVSNVYWKSPDNNLIKATYRGVFCGGEYHLGNGTVIDSSECSGLTGMMNDCNWFESYCGSGIFANAPQASAMTLWIILRIVFWVCVAGVLHRKRWYWAL